MTKMLKSIAAGVGSVFVEIPSARDYQKLPRNGFRQDAENLRCDGRKVVSTVRKNAMKEKDGQPQ